MANKKTKTTKEQKNIEEKAAAGGSPVVPQSASIPPQPKSGKGCLTCGIIAAVVVILLIFVFVGLQILSFWFPPTFLFGFLSRLNDAKNITEQSGQLSSDQKGTLRGKNLAGLIDPSKTITKRIIAKNGGQITARSASGKYFTVHIGPGSLKYDTDISITPINESPIEGYPNPDDPGVVIGPDNTNLGDDSTVTVSEDPPVEPANPGSSGTDPGTGADGGTTNPPGTPPETPPDTPPGTPPTTPPGISGELPDLSHLADLLGNNTMTTTPSGNPSGQGSGGTTGNTGANGDDRNTGSGSPSGSGARSGSFSDRTVIIFTGYGGGVSGAPTSHSDDGDSATAPIDQTGGTSTDNPDPNESQDLANNAAANSGGTCSPEFLQAMANASQAGGAGSQAAQAALRDCFNTEWLNNLCVNDPVKLRRTNFEQRIVLARRFDERVAGVIESLMNQCQARYHFYGEGINPISADGVMIFSSLDANVCGYVDDEWTGTQIYQLSVEGGGHYFGGTANFHLPPGGGEFTGISHGSNDYTVAGRRVEIPNFDFGFIGHFDGYKTILDLNLYPATIVSARPIELQEKPCVPVAPLPR